MFSNAFSPVEADPAGDIRSSKSDLFELLGGTPERKGFFDDKGLPGLKGSQQFSGWGE